MTTLLLGTVAIEPNRWGAVSKDRAPTVASEAWLARAIEAGFDGVELWEHHATQVDEAEARRLIGSKLPIRIFNSYVSFDEEADAQRLSAASWLDRLGCEGVKYNVGPDADAEADYVARLGRWSDAIRPDVRLICECHSGTLAETPAVAARMLEAAGPADRFHALVHLGDDVDHIDAMFEALGERISHVHVNFLRQKAPLLEDIAADVVGRIDRIRELGFVGSFTLEFTHGVLSANDTLEATLDAAVSDLRFLREVLD